MNFNRVFHYKVYPFWGTPIFGNIHVSQIKLFQYVADLGPHTIYRVIEIQSTAFGCQSGSISANEKIHLENPSTRSHPSYPGHGPNNQQNMFELQLMVQNLTHKLVSLYIIGVDSANFHLSTYKFPKNMCPISTCHWWFCATNLVAVWIQGLQAESLHLKPKLGDLRSPKTLEVVVTLVLVSFVDL